MELRTGKGCSASVYLRTQKNHDLCFIPQNLGPENLISVSSEDDQAPLPPLPPPPPPPPPRVPAPGEDRDLLTCGQCSQSFPLAHILAFIQHKQGDCSARNQARRAGATPPSPADHAESVPDPEPVPGFIQLRRGGWGEEPGVKAELGRTGEQRERKKRAGC